MTRHIELSMSRDGAHTSADPRQAPLPDYGDYSDPMPTWRRLGNGRHFVAFFRCTEPCTLKIFACAIQVE